MSQIEVMTLVVVLLVLVGFIFISISLFWSNRNNKIAQHATTRIKGEVVDYYSVNQRYWAPVVEFEVNGKYYQSKLSYRFFSSRAHSFEGGTEVIGDPLGPNLNLKGNIHFSTNPLEKVFPKGTEMTVYYNRNNPEENYVERFVGSLIPRIFLINGIGVIVIAGLFYLLFLM